MAREDRGDKSMVTVGESVSVVPGNSVATPGRNIAAASVQFIRLAPGVSGEDLHGRPVCRTVPQGTRAQIAKRRQGWALGGHNRAAGMRRDPYRELGL